jgi:hypothetical protein
MTVSVSLPAPSRAASNSLFRPGGDGYTILPDPAFDLLEPLLPKPLRKAIMNALPRVVRFLVKLAQAGELDERVTDQRIARAAGISDRMVQYVLWALDVVMRTIGLPIINRTPSHGRRFIEFVRGFVARGSAPASVPPLHPPEEIPGTTTTREASSSLGSGEQKTGEAREIAPPELVDRACRLVPEATPGKVADAVAVHSADWVNQALDRVVKRNSKPGNKPVESWGFVLRILENWKRLDGPPPPKPTALPNQARPKAEPPKAEPPQRLMPAELAELLAKCRSGNRTESSFARVTLRKALDEGAIPAELVATIPAELVNPPKPRAP